MPAPTNTFRNLTIAASASALMLLGAVGGASAQEVEDGTGSDPVVGVQQEHSVSAISGRNDSKGLEGKSKGKSKPRGKSAKLMATPKVDVYRTPQRFRSDDYVFVAIRQGKRRLPLQATGYCNSSVVTDRVAARVNSCGRYSPIRVTYVSFKGKQKLVFKYRRVTGR